MNYLLDTNVLSEFRKESTGRNHPNVSAWARSVPLSSLYVSVVSVLELEVGILLKERRDPVQGSLLRSWFASRLLPNFADRMMPIDIDVAMRCAKLHVPNPRPERDAMIAATALNHGMTVVTRNVADFAGTGVAVFDPWSG